MAREADLVFVGGRVFTAARVRPWAEGMAIRNDRFVAVGTESQVEQWTGRQTRRIDLHGRVVVPGLNGPPCRRAKNRLPYGLGELPGARARARPGWTSWIRRGRLGEADRDPEGRRLLRTPRPIRIGAGRHRTESSQDRTDGASSR